MAVEIVHSRSPGNNTMLTGSEQCVQSAPESEQRKLGSGNGDAQLIEASVGGLGLRPRLGRDSSSFFGFDEDHGLAT